jgi:hypothetical protein
LIINADRSNSNRNGAKSSKTEKRKWKRGARVKRIGFASSARCTLRKEKRARLRNRTTVRPFSLFSFPFSEGTSILSIPAYDEKA